MRGGVEEQVQINSPDELEKWLEDKPKSWAQAIAVRAALRIIPVLIHVYREETFDEELLDHLTISILRACFISDVAVVGLSSEIKLVVIHAAGNAARVAARAAVLAEYVRDAANAARAAAYAAYAADATNAAVLAGSGVQAADHAAEFAANVGDFSRAAYVTDAQWLDGQGDRRDAAFLLASQPLWLNVDSSFGYEWRELVKNLLADDFNWKFWIDWYQSKLDGTAHNGLRGGNRERLYLEITQFPNELWEEGAEVVNAKIAELLADLSSEGETFYLDDGYLDHDFLNLDIEPQKSGALRFQTDEQGKIGLDHDSEDEKLDQSEGATNRHSEVFDNTTSLIKSFNPNEPGANACKPLIEKVEKYSQALGDGPGEVNIDFLIPRGEALRNALKRAENKDDFYDNPELPPAIKEHLSNIVAAHNIYVELDPVLATRDHARLGPDAKLNMIAPEEAQPIIEQAVHEGIITQEAHDAFAEEAEVAPSVVDPENRNSRRFSESVKNLKRAFLSILDTVGRKTIDGMETTGKLVRTSAVTVLMLTREDYTKQKVKFIIEHEEWFLKDYKNNPIIHAGIKSFIDYLKKESIFHDD